jgi:hypothetical protein
MNLDWDFYYDKWLIDKVPDGLEIKIVDRGGGVECIPPSLTCYFGANPIYLYGKGKLWHESILSPRGIAIFPEFLQRPGFEWINRNTFKVDFPSTTDFFNRNVVAMHIGKVNATRYLHDTLKMMYGVETTDFVDMKTASTGLRLMNADDYNLIERGVSDKQIFLNMNEMTGEHCIFYSRMFIENGRIGPAELVRGVDLVAKTPGAPILIPGSFTRVLFLKYSHIEIPSIYVSNMFRTPSWALLFRTLPNFREGVLLDFGSTNFTEDTNYGARISINIESMEVILNDGNLNRFNFPLNVDFRFAHSWALRVTDDVLFLAIDGTLVATHDISNLGPVQYSATYPNFISKIATSGDNQYTGDIEELAWFDGPISDDKVNMFLEGLIPLLKKGGVDALESENIPHALSYGLTFTKPTDFYIPNYFNADFYKFYLKDKDDLVIIATTDAPAVNSSYRSDLEPYHDKSLLIPFGFNIDQVLAIENGNDDPYGSGLQPVKPSYEYDYPCIPPQESDALFAKILSDAINYCKLP